MSQAEQDYRIEVGMSPLTAAFATAANVIILFGLFALVLRASDHPRLVPAILAWVVLLGTILAQQVAARRMRWVLPAWSFPTLLLALLVVVALDVSASWGLPDVYPSATVASGAALLIVVTADRPRELIIGAGVIGIIVALILLSQPHEAPLQFASDIVAVALAIIPPLVGTVMVRAFRLLVRRELDRAQTRAMVTAPRLTVGMLTSDELARLDLDAERLLDGVASGRLALPLTDDRASAAAALATQLRLHLIDGRRETWLHHALAESTFLGPAVTLTDPDSLAGLLDARQRNGLLSAVWLLVGDPKRGASALHVTITDADSGTIHAPVTSVRVRLSAEGVRAAQLEGETWNAINGIGSHVETLSGADLRVDIVCVVDTTVEHAGT